MSPALTTDLTPFDQPTLFDGCWYQRWNHGTTIWQYTTDDPFRYFSPSRYTVVPLDEKTARAFTTTHHYSQAWPAAQLRFGLIEDGEHLVGTCVLGVPIRAEVLTGPFPAFEPYRQSMELVRLVLLDRIPANAESWFVSRVFREAARLGVRGVIAYSEPQPRRVGDRMLMPGHIGTVYQALSAVYIGRGTVRWLTMLPNGTVLNDRTRSKITGKERGGNGAIARLVAMGAPAKPAGMPGREWLPEALVAVGARKVRHPGNHRYAWSIGPRWSRRAYPVAMPAVPYPKQISPVGVVA